MISDFSYCTKAFLGQDLFTNIKDNCPCDHAWPTFELAINVGICVSQTHLVLSFDDKDFLYMFYRCGHYFYFLHLCKYKTQNVLLKVN